jgi:uncharacterized protein YbjT (DUF2867 family)
MKVLVYGGTGSQGGAVAWSLLEAGHTPYILTRAPERAAALVEKGAHTAHGDMTDYASLLAASRGMDAVAFMTPAFVPNPMQMPMMAMNAINAAKEAGVGLLVYNTSGTVIEQQVGHPMYDGRRALVQAVMSSGIPAITIEPTAYLENLFGPWTRPNIIAHDTLTYPIEPDQRTGWIATRDVGALIAAALERPHLAGTRFKVSGERSVTGPELAAAMSEGLGRTITYQALTLDEFAAALDAAFGPGAGEGGKQGYQFQRDNPDLLVMWHDMTPVLEQLPVQMTSIAAWAAQNRHVFSAAEGVTA